MNNIPTIDAYIAGFPESTQKILEQLRAVIHKAAPGATEKISYGMPAFVWYGNLVYFAAYEKHIGLYALPSGNEAFKKELSDYKMGKGSIQFPINQPMPLELIARIVRFRVLENEEKARLKDKK